MHTAAQTHHLSNDVSLTATVVTGLEPSKSLVVHHLCEYRKSFVALSSISKGDLQSGLRLDAGVRLLYRRCPVGIRVGAEFLPHYCSP